MADELLPLPISPHACLEQVVRPALALLPPKLTDPRAEVMMLAIALQESALAHRRQLPARPGGPWGPARGLWQFERGGGVRGVLRHPASKVMAIRLCQLRRVSPDAQSVWLSLPADDLLAAGFARLLLWTDPAPLPALGDQGGAWAYYERNWRPGKPHPDRWPSCYSRALSAPQEEQPA